jgi:hypothetical protein
MPLLGLLVTLVLVPGALAHHCSPDGNTPPGDGFSAQTIPPSTPPLAIAAFALIPIVGLLLALVIALPSMRKTAVVSGTWRFNGTAYEWVPSTK